MTPTQQRIYEAIRANPGISVGDLQSDMGFATTQALQAHLRSMLKGGHVKQVPAKPSGWVLSEQMKEKE